MRTIAKGQTMAAETKSNSSETARDGDAYVLDRRTVTLYAVDVGDKAQIEASMALLHAADIADLLERIDPFDRTRLVRLYKGALDGDVLSELYESIRVDPMGILEPQTLADAIRDMDSDDVGDLVEDLAEPRQEAILDVPPLAEKLAVQQSLSFPEDSVGRSMQHKVVTVPEFWTVGEAIDFCALRITCPNISTMSPWLTPGCTRSATLRWSR